MNRSELERHLARQINLISRTWQQAADQVLAQLGVSSSTGWCLIYVDRLGEDVRQSDLARALSIRDASLVRLLHQLEAAGLIERETNTTDRRVNHVVLTEQGRMLSRRIEDELARQRASFLEGVDDPDIEATLRVCEALSARIGDRYSRT
jgi:MarR family transcriptional regulator for hemolysin